MKKFVAPAILFSQRFKALMPPTQGKVNINE
jgi:hypothetical protein